MPMASLRNISLHYELQGEGEPLLLIMGYRSSGCMWGEELVALLSGAFQVIVFDNRGTGLSDKPDTAYTLATMADDAAGLLRHLGIARAHVFGVSMGGMIAQELALRHAQQVRRLVLGCTSCGGPQARLASLAVFAQFLASQNMPHAAALRQQWPVLVSAAFRATPQAVLERLTACALASPTPSHTAYRHMLAMQRFNTYGRLGQITAPTLVMTGDQDCLVPPANARLLVEKIPGARLHIIAGTGHGFFWEAPAAVCSSLREFCHWRSASSFVP